MLEETAAARCVLQEARLTVGEPGSQVPERIICAKRKACSSPSPFLKSPAPFPSVGTLITSASLVLVLRSFLCSAHSF